MSHHKLLLSIVLATSNRLPGQRLRPAIRQALGRVGRAGRRGRRRAQRLPSDDELRERIDRAVNFGRANRHLDGDQNAAWQIVHGLLAFGKDFEIYRQGKLIPALDYLLGGGELNGWKLRKGDHGVQSILEAGSKTGMGHPDQWLGYLSQCGLQFDEPLMVAGQEYHVDDLLTQAQWDIYPGMEATWTLMAFATYLPLDAEWTARDGSEWTIDRIVDMEADQDIDASPCGGTHRLYGLALALNRHLAEGGQLTGAWQKADRQIQAAIAKAKANQQPDGSFSSQFFLRPAFSDDIDKRLGASGHTFEFLTLALNERAVRRAVDDAGAGGPARHARADRASRTGMRRPLPRHARFGIVSAPSIRRPPMRRRPPLRHRTATDSASPAGCADRPRRPRLNESPRNRGSRAQRSAGFSPAVSGRFFRRRGPHQPACPAPVRSLCRSPAR